MCEFVPCKCSIIEQQNMHVSGRNTPGPGADYRLDGQAHVCVGMT